MKYRLAFFALFLFGGVALADNWPAWRGPTGQGYCTEQNLPTKWSDKENVKWRIKLPASGNSTPVVWGDKIFLTYATKGGNVRTIASFHRADGKQLWKHDIHYPGTEKNWTNDWYANSSPTTDGERVIVSFGSAGLFCFDLNGKELWKRTDLGEWYHKFGNASSPVLYRNLCILYKGPDEKKGPRGLLAVEKATGKTVWDKPSKVRPKEQADFGSWGTPILVEIDGKDQLLHCRGYSLESVDPKTGEDLWHCDGLMEYVYTSPLYSPKHKIAVAMSGFNKSALAVKVGGSGDITKNRLWHHPKNDQRVGSGVIHGDHVYILDQGGVPKCYELVSGKEVWSADRVSGTNWGSMVLAGDKLYMLTRDGSTFILKASPTFELIATNRLGKGQSTNSSPAISNGEIFLRTNQNLWCVSAKK